MHRFDVGAVILDGTYDTVAAATAAARVELASAGADGWAVDVALRAATYDRSWWSDSYGGSVHDCAGHSRAEHDPGSCFPDARQVTVVSGLPPAMTGHVDQAVSPDPRLDALMRKAGGA